MDRRGLTLIELLIAITISAILAGTTVLMLKSSLDAYTFSQDEAFTQKILDETLAQLSSGTYNTWGIQDAVEITEARVDAFSFMPLWVDSSHRIASMATGEQEFVLNRPFKAGAPLPIFEFKRSGSGEFGTAAIKFFLAENNTQGVSSPDRVILAEPLPSDASLINIIFHPDSGSFSDTVMKISWSAQKSAFIRQYGGRTDIIPPKVYKEFKLNNAAFQYYDNNNTEILPASSSGAVAQDSLSSITAIKINLYITPSNAERGKTRQASSFVNLRNTRSFGSGILLRAGTRVKIPDSEHIRTLSVGNIIGVQEGDIIQFQAEGEKGGIWQVTLHLGIKDELSVIKQYTIEYPLGTAVYSETMNLTTDLPMNLLNLGNSRFDYDLDKGIDNTVNLGGNVIFVVTRMDCAGAALFVRP
jgi:prepilin-type N-terminal cleavage/methylation domain-containing protein